VLTDVLETLMTTNFATSSTLNDAAWCSRIQRTAWEMWLRWLSACPRWRAALLSGDQPPEDLSLDKGRQDGIVAGRVEQPKQAHNGIQQRLRRITTVFMVYSFDVVRST